MTEQSDRFHVALGVYRDARDELEAATQWWDQFLPTDGGAVSEPDTIAVREAFHIIRAAEHKFDRALAGLWETFQALPRTRDEPTPRA